LARVELASASDAVVRFRVLALASFRRSWLRCQVARACFQRLMPISLAGLEHIRRTILDASSRVVDLADQLAFPSRWPLS